MEKITLFWFRRDLRLEDNSGLYYACRQEGNVLPLFIFDTEILEGLEDKSDARVTFIHAQITRIHAELGELGSTIWVKTGKPIEVFRSILSAYNIASVYTNRDYEPYALKRDEEVARFLEHNGVQFYDFKDQVIFEKDEIAKEDGSFYKVFTPYSKKWTERLQEVRLTPLQIAPKGLWKTAPKEVPTLSDLGFKASEIQIPSPEVNQQIISRYDKTRDFPAQLGTSRLGIHLRFGSISIRQLVTVATGLNKTYLNELVWREFYMMILYHNPQVVDRAFKPVYDRIVWRNDEVDFAAWCSGNTGYPLVDAGMRELNTTGYMHNRVRMVVASFLTKHLLIDWRWGEAYFAKKLLDYELASNNGGWQWAAGTGTDAQPYFRIFNPASQQKKFDPEGKYVSKWVPEWKTDKYVSPIVDHSYARQRALDTYKAAVSEV